MTLPRGLLHQLVDYAGTYPPASLPPDAALAEYAQARQTPAAWMLGRLVWPAALLDQLRAVRTDPGGWPVSLVLTTVDRTTLDAVNAFTNAVTSCRIAALEVRLTPGLSKQVRDALPRGVEVYAEIPADQPALVEEVAAAGWHAKLRTGGVTADAFPDAEHIVDFALACARAGVAFKATAGLHHALRGEYPLTYEPGCARGTMHGFLNLLAAVGAVEAGERAEAVRLLRSTTPPPIPEAAAAAMIRARFHAFGSCSFREPTEDLVRMGLA